MAAEKVNKAIQSMLTKLPHMELAASFSSIAFLFTVENGWLQHKQFPVNFIVSDWGIAYKSWANISKTTWNLKPQQLGWLKTFQVICHGLEKLEMYKERADFWEPLHIPGFDNT